MTGQNCILSDDLDGPFVTPPKFTMTNKLSDYYRFEEKRLASFEKWPCTSPVDKARLAKAGFIYTGENDEVQCFSCSGRIGGWVDGDSPFLKHKAFFPLCDFVKGISNNVPMINFRHTNNVSEELLSNIFNGTSSKPSILNLHHQNKRAQSQNEIKPKNGFINGNFQVSSPSMPSDYRLEENRLRTFKSWPHVFISPEKLAESGFYYLYSADKVQCAFCHGIVSDWEPNDDPLQEHKRHFPNCPFIQHKDVGNIPLASFRWYSTNGASFDVAGSTAVNITTSTPFRGRPLPLKLKEMGINELKGPQHISQASEDARYRSFATWDKNSPINVKDLVDAGFFYIGIGDCTKCFYCDGGLCNWMAGDDPWKEHARWFPFCAFVQLNKGPEFIEACIKNKPPVEPEVEPSTSYASSSSQSRSLSSLKDAKDVDELMQSRMVKNFLEAEVFPYNMVHTAMLRQYQETGRGFESEDELCQAVMYLQLLEDVQKDELEKNPSQTSTVNGTIFLPESGCMNQSDELSKSIIMPSREDVSHDELAAASSSLESADPKPSHSKVSNDAAPPPTRNGTEALLCKICLDKEVGMVFLPCGHLIACTRCGPALKNCPLCRKSIQGAVRTFLS